MIVKKTRYASFLEATLITMAMAYSLVLYATLGASLRVVSISIGVACLSFLTAYIIRILREAEVE